MRFTFPKTDKLKSHKALGALFKAGISYKSYPLLMVYLPWENEDAQVKAAFSVSKRKFKLAVDRNRIKRQMKEAYRLQKPLILSGLNHQYAVIFIYLHHQKVAFDQIEQSMQKCLHHLKKKDGHTPPNS